MKYKTYTHEGWEYKIPENVDLLDTERCRPGEPCAVHADFDNPDPEGKCYFSHRYISCRDCLCDNRNQEALLAYIAEQPEPEPETWEHLMLRAEYAGNAAKLAVLRGEV